MLTDEVMFESLIHITFSHKRAITWHKITDFNIVENIWYDAHNTTNHIIKDKSLYRHFNAELLHIISLRMIFFVALGQQNKLIITILSFYMCMY